MSLYRICLIAITFASIAFAVIGYTAHKGDGQRIVELEKRIADLECRHILYEDGSSSHADAEVVAECVYTAPVFAKYGN